MTNSRLEQLRDLVNAMIISDNYEPNELVKKSQELDELIVEEMKEKYIGKSVSDKDYRDEFITIISNMNAFTKMYDSIRLVDPLRKEVLTSEQGDLRMERSKCYSFWGKDKFCEDCISTRAYNEDDAVFKLEYQGIKKIYLVTAIPIRIHGRKLVAELLKDVTYNLSSKMY